MEIKVKRKFFGENYCIGDMYLDGVFFCHTLEDPVRIVDTNNDGKYSTEELAAKIKHQTAIPAGYYNVILTESQRFKRVLPLLLNVPGFDGIRIHPGNTQDDTSGCILVGHNNVKGKVTESKVTFEDLMTELHMALQKGEKIHISIK